MKHIRTEILIKCSEMGWTFQEPFITHLTGIVERRRRGLNPEQLKFWLAMASEEQLEEAFNDTISVLKLIHE